MTSPNLPAPSTAQIGAPSQAPSQQQAGSPERPGQQMAQPPGQTRQPGAPTFTDWASI